MRVHFIGIAGRAMGGIAAALMQAGHEVSGSDENVYEPMHSLLASAGIRPTHYAVGHVPRDADVVVAGRRVGDDNPELQHTRRLGLPCVSFPAFLREHFLARSRNVVVAGGVGKTTTTAMLAWILEHAGLEPDYLIGGVARNFGASCRLAGARIAVLEGDEYASGPGDGAPKFLHYRPEVVIVTNLLADHPDLYPTADSIHRAFVALAELVPEDGCLLHWSGDDEAGRLAREAGCVVAAVGTTPAADVAVDEIRLMARGSSFRIDGITIDLPQHGAMNVRNAAMAAVAARRFGVSFAQSAQALAAFEGLPDRQEAFEAGGRTLVRDKASHPASLSELCAALRQRFPRRRVVSLMQPRATGGRRWIYQRDLPVALAAFDAVILTPPYEHRPAAAVGWQHEPFCLETLASDLRRLGVPVHIVADVSDAPAAVRAESVRGDVVLLSLREQFSSTIDAVIRALAPGLSPR